MVIKVIGRKEILLFFFTPDFIYLFINLIS